MPFSESLRITLPRAADIGNLQVVSRQYELTIFCHIANGYHKLVLDKISYTPVHIPTQLWTYRNGMEAGQYGGSGGVIPVLLEIGTNDPMQLTLFNLSVDSEAQFTFHFVGYMAYDV